MKTQAHGECGIAAVMKALSFNAFMTAAIPHSQERKTENFQFCVNLRNLNYSAAEIDEARRKYLFDPAMKTVITDVEAHYASEVDRKTQALKKLASITSSDRFFDAMPSQEAVAGLTWLETVNLISAFIEGVFMPTYTWLDQKDFDLIASSLECDIVIYREVRGSNALMETYRAKSGIAPSIANIHIVYCNCNERWGDTGNHFEPLVFLVPCDEAGLYYVNRENFANCADMFAEIILKPDVDGILVNTVTGDGSIMTSPNKSSLYDHTTILEDLRKVLEYINSLPGTEKTEKCMKILNSGKFVNHNQALGLQIPGESEEWSHSLTTLTKYYCEKKGEIESYHLCRNEKFDPLSNKRMLFFGYNTLLGKQPAYWRIDLISKLNIFLYFCYYFNILN